MHSKGHCFFLNPLISMIHRHGRSYLEEQLEDLNLPSGQYSYLLYLYHHDGQKQEEIVKNLRMDKAGTTRALKRLEKNGYVFRKTDEKDRRGNYVYLTEKAWQIQPRLLKAYNNWLNLALEGLTDSELDFLHQILNRIAINAISLKAEKDDNLVDQTTNLR